MAGDIQKYYEFLANRYANPDIWGSSGAYFNGLPNLGSGDSRYSLDPIGEAGATINGQQYVRTGTTDNSRFDPFGGGAIYDPTYGWVVPSSVASAYGDSDNSSELAFSLALGALAAPYAASTGLASFGGGTQSGVFGPGGELVPSTYGGVSPGAVADAPWGVNPADGATGGVGDFYGSLGENAGIGSTPTNVLTGSAASSAVPGTGAMEAMGSSSLPSWLTNLMPKGGDLTSLLLGKVAPAALGAYGANQQADAYRDIANQYFGIGAPYRDLLQKSYQPGFDLNNEPGFKNAMDTGLNTWLRAASAGRASGVSSGNPLDPNNAGASIEGQKYITGSLALPYLTNYRSGLSQSGGLGLGPAAQFGGNAIQSDKGVYDAIGFGLNDIFNPKPQNGISIDPKTGQIKINTGSALV